MRVSDLVGAMDIHRAASSFAASWDNVGLLVGDPARAAVARASTIDCTREVLAEGAQGGGGGAIVAYHPVLFEAQKRFVAGSVAFEAARAGLSVYCPHTALDVAPGGTNDVLADAIGMRDQDAAAHGGRRRREPEARDLRPRRARRGGEPGGVRGGWRTDWPVHFVQLPFARHGRRSSARWVLSGRRASRSSRRGRRGAARDCGARRGHRRDCEGAATRPSVRGAGVRSGAAGSSSLGPRAGSRGLGRRRSRRGARRARQARLGARARPGRRLARPRGHPCGRVRRQRGGPDRGRPLAGAHLLLTDARTTTPCAPSRGGSSSCARGTPRARGARWSTSRAA